MKAKGKKDDESPLTGGKKRERKKERRNNRIPTGMFIFDMLGVMNGYPLTTTLGKKERKKERSF